MHQSSLRASQISVFAGILILYPGESEKRYAERIRNLIELLETPLSRPGFISRIYLPSQRSYTPLCVLHKPLNALAVHSVFTLISLEVGVRLNSLIVSGRDKNGHETWDSHILNLRSLHAMWLRPDVMRKTFENSLTLQSHNNCDWDYMTKWSYQPDGCEACMLARLTGDLDTVMDLRMVVKSRMYSKMVKKHGNPRLWAWIDAWLRCWHGRLVSSDLLDEIEKRMSLNDARAQRLKDNRKEIMKEKRRHKKKSGAQKEESVRRRKKLSHSQVSAYRYMTPEDHVQAEKRKQEDKTSSSAHRSARSERYDDPSNLKEWNGAPPAFGLPPMPSFQDAENEGEAEVDVEETAHDAENSVIDAYLALISTPFLPGMDTTQHEKAETVLSDSFEDRIRREEHARPDSEVLPENYPYSHRPPSGYSASIYSTDSPSHPEYVPPRTGWTKGHKPRYASNDRRSHQAEFDSTSRVSSWVDASVPPTPSTPTINRHSRRPDPDEIRRKLEQTRPQTIQEEHTRPRSPTMRRTQTTTTRRNSARRNSQRIRRRHNSDTRAVSPISPSGDVKMKDLSPVSPTGPNSSDRTTYSSSYKFSEDPSYQHYPTPPPGSRSHTRTTSRLSRPMSGPAPEHVSMSTTSSLANAPIRLTSTRHRRHSRPSNSNPHTTTSRPSHTTTTHNRPPPPRRLSRSTGRTHRDPPPRAEKERTMSTATHQTTWADVLRAADTTGIIDYGPDEKTKAKEAKKKAKEKDKGKRSFFS